MATTTTTDAIPALHIKKHIPKSTSWPYSPSDFKRADPSPDPSFYTTPRYVAHIDDAAISRLTAYYATQLPETGSILDICTSWNSWFPSSHAQAAARGDLGVWGIGMNAAELGRNALWKGKPGRGLVRDLNEEADVRRGWLEGNELPVLDAATCVVSIDYLVQPVEVLRSVRAAMREGGRVHLVVSNRCFPTKAVGLWLRLGTEERLALVGDYLHFAGWKDVEIVDLCARDQEGRRITDENGTVLQVKGLRGLLGLEHMDPLWVVRGTK